MQKRNILILTLLSLFVLLLCACKAEPAATEPPAPEALTAFLPGTTLNGAELSGKTPEEAAQQLKKACEDYTLSVTLDGVTFPMKSAQLGLSYIDSTDLAALLAQQDAAREQLRFELPALYEIKAPEALPAALLTARDAAKAEPSEPSEPAEPSESSEPAEPALLLDDPRRAHLVYDAENGVFTGADGASGVTVLYDKAVQEICEAACRLAPEVKVSSETQQTEGEKAEGNEALAAAIDEANAYLAVSLDYSFTPEGKETSHEAIGRGLIAQWLLIQPDGLSVALDTESISAYCSRLANAHSVGGSPVKFKTTYGSLIDVNMYGGGQSVNTDALYSDLLSCLQNRRGGSRTAPYYAPVKTSGTVDFGGNYVELDLDSQMAYCYKGGALICSTPIISGNVYYDNWTPTGVYTIKSKDTNRYLSGPGYRVWVDMFMPFNGGIGLHDCSWHSVFGGTRYLYLGSHGCINMPHAAAMTFFQNVSVGTHVVVYGGITSVEGREQVWTGRDSYVLAPDAAPFRLDIRPSGNAPVSRYSSSNNAVCTVSADGTVTPVGLGSCVITVESEGTVTYINSKKEIRITVQKTENAITASGTLILNPGASAVLNASCLTGGTLRYESSDESVAAVGADGSVTAVGCGVCEITITSPETDTYAASVKKVSVQVVRRAQSLSGTAAYACTVGDAPFRLDVAALGGAALSYESSDGAVAAVSADGTVSVTGAGTCVITVTAAETAEYQSGIFTVTITVAPA